MLVKRCLHRVQRISCAGQSLYGSDFLVLGLDRKHETGPDRFPIEQNGAGAANAMFASEINTRKAAAFT